MLELAEVKKLSFSQCFSLDGEWELSQFSVFFSLLRQWDFTDTKGSSSLYVLRSANFPFLAVCLPQLHVRFSAFFWGAYHSWRGTIQLVSSAST